MKNHTPSSCQVSKGLNAFLQSGILINRLELPVYPEWVGHPVNPELEKKGPGAFDIVEDVEEWVSSLQESGAIPGKILYEELVNSGEIQNCLNLQDGLAIQRFIDPVLFFETFEIGEKYLFGSVVFHKEDRHGFFAPCIYSEDYSVKIGWRNLKNYWSANRPLLRFKDGVA